MNEGYRPKLSDFGTTIYPDCEVYNEVGTFGYMDPNYVNIGQVTFSSDVYSFGMALLELLTGHKVNDSKREGGQQNLILWVSKLLILI